MSHGMNSQWDVSTWWRDVYTYTVYQLVRKGQDVGHPSGQVQQSPQSPVPQALAAEG